MPSSCCVIGCKSRGTAQPGVLFFQLPLNKPPVLTQWLIVLDRRDWIPKPSSRICSLHFAPDDYITRPNQTTPRLKPDAIPSVFPDLGDDEDEKDSSPSSPQKENDLPSEKALEKTDEPPVKLLSSKSKPHATVSTPPVSMSPSQRPRRVSKVSSKMKDYILLDDIKKNRPNSSPASKVTKTDPAAQELLSILEDSDSLSGDESKFSSLKARQPTVIASSETKTPILSEKKGILIASSEVRKASLSDKKGISIQDSLTTKINLVDKVKQKPAPASVKRAKELASLKQNSIAKGLTEENKIPSKKQSPVKLRGKPVPEAFRKTYFQIKDGDKVIYLSYADLNPVADMTKDNVLYKTPSSSGSLTNLDSLLDKEIKEERIDSETDGACGSSQQETDNGESSSLIELHGATNEIARSLQNSTKKKQNKRTAKKVDEDFSNSQDLTENGVVANVTDDADMVDSDSSLKLLSDKNIGSPAIKKVSKNFKVTSPVKRKKRFKTVAEIVVRTDNSGQIPSVSIEKMTNLETNETPRKRAKIVNKPATPPIQNNFVTPSTEEDDLSTLSERITETIKKMKLLEKVKGNAAKLTVLITTLPPVQENELLIIKKKNTETNAEQSRELRVAISSYKAHNDANQSGEILNNQQSNGGPVFGVPILGACESGEPSGKETTVELTLHQESKIISGNQENLASAGNVEINTGESTELANNPETSDNSIPGTVRNDTVVTPPSGKEGGSDGTGVPTSAPLQHDHTYISPSLKVATEPEVIGDDHVKELFSKLKLTEEEISYRSKVHKKLRFLKETVKRKTETINKLKQKVIFLEKSLREERKNKKKLNVVSKRKPGYESNSFYEGMMEGKSSSFQGNSTADFEENLEESDEDGRGSNSPITYICEPAIDVCEKPEPEE